MWHGRYYADVQGQEQRKHMSMPLGLVSEMTKPEAKRKLREQLDKLGVNTSAYLDRAACGERTFRMEAEWFTKNRLPLMKKSTQAGMAAHLNKHLLPRFASLPVDGIDTRKVQEMVTELVNEGLSPGTISTVMGTLRLVVRKKIWRDWDILMPRRERKEQRYFTEFEMRQIVDASDGQWQVIFAVMAGTGMRAGEALAVHVEDIDLGMGTITVRRGSWMGTETTPKTLAGYRTVNIDDGLAAILRQHIGERRSGPLFQTRNGTLVRVDGLRVKLHSILREIAIPKGGLHAFRHGRVSLLQASGVPGDLVKSWIGHTSLDMTSRYTHFDEKFRHDIANSVGSPNVSPKLSVSDSGYGVN